MRESTFLDANLKGASIHGLDLLGVTDFQQSQLYSTSSYQRHELGSINLGFRSVSAWNFANQDLVGAGFESSTAALVNFERANE